jgi:hypothetical protein
MIDAKNLQDFANSLSTGYLKSWKADGMKSTLTMMPQIIEDHDRLLAYVKNCLLMEGFSVSDCETITEYLLSN